MKNFQFRYLKLSLIQKPIKFGVDAASHLLEIHDTAQWSATTNPLIPIFWGDTLYTTENSHNIHNHGQYLLSHVDRQVVISAKV